MARERAARGPGDARVLSLARSPLLSRAAGDEAQPPFALSLLSRYFLALLLMLVAMTMNVGLVGSALFGYFAGDAMFLSRAPRPPSGHGAANVDACCA